MSELQAAWSPASPTRGRHCKGGCNGHHGGEVDPRADYPAKRQPWRCKLFYCPMCCSWQPWCRGAAASTPALCDGCAPTARGS